MKLYRAMIEDSNGQPLLGRSARALGIRTPTEVHPGSFPDVPATASNEIIQPGNGGLSTAPDDPMNLMPFRRPLVLRGSGKDPVWEIDTNDLGSELQYRQDSPTHVLIEPARPMTLQEYESALNATVSRWIKYSR